MKHQFKRILALLLAVVMVLGVMPSVFAANVGPFTDVQENAWYAPYVKAVFENGLMKGVNEDQFKPEDTCTRGQVVTVLYRIEGQPPVGGPATFTDLTADWYKNPVAWAQKNGIVNGLSATKFGPDVNVTREQLVTMIWRYYGEPAGTGDLSVFPDNDKISDYAKEAFAWAIGEGIINGSNGKLNPQDKATRAQFAKIIWLAIPEPCDHQWDNGVVTKEPTCVASGTLTYTCEICKETRTQTIPATGEHTWTETITTQPTCGSYGVKTLTCSVCGTSVTESIDPTGVHTYENGVCTGCGMRIGEKFGRVDELQEGDEVIIVCDSKNIALGADYGSSYYNPGVAVNPVDGIIENSDNTIVWTVGKEGDFYTFSYEGQKIGMGTEYTSMTLGGVNYKWELREAKNAATFYLANLDRDPSQAYFMQWYEAKTYWSGYYNLNDELMALAFYVKGADPIEIGGGETTVPTTTDPDPEEEFVRVNELKEGAEIIIVCDSRNIALGADYAGSFYNPGVAVEPVDGKITTSDKTIVWTVGREGEYYTFSYNGQKIAMGTGYSSMPLGEVNYKWIVSPAEKEGTFYVGNPDRDPSKGIYYMQWYEEKGYWSAYYNLNDELMALAFYAKDAEPGPGPCTHAWDEGKVTKEPTCSEIGVKTYTCTLCEATKTESIPATGEHTYENGTCIGCGKKENNEPIPEGYVAIYNVANSVVMTDEVSIYNTKEQYKAAAATLVDGKLTTEATNVALFKMTTDENGKTTFTTKDGKFLEADGNSIRFVDEENANTLFVLEEAEGGYYIRLDTAVSYNKAQYIEYYTSKGVYTVYGMGSDTTMYIFNFYEVEVTEPAPTETEPAPTETTETTEPTEATELTEGKYVIAAYVDGKYYAMANVFDTKINGTEITVTDGKVAAADAAGFAIDLAKSGTGWTIKGAEGYLSYVSSTNLGTSEEAYVWNITASTVTAGLWNMIASTSPVGKERVLMFQLENSSYRFGGYAISNVGKIDRYVEVVLLPVA